MILSVDSTCIDILMQHYHSGRNNDLYTDLLKSLFEQDLQITRYTYKTAAQRSHDGLAVLAGIRYGSFTSPLLDGNEILEAVFMKSDHKLRDLLHHSTYLHALDADTPATALIISTITGWMDGCRILLNINLVEYLEDPSSDAWRSRPTLLMLSAATNQLDLLQFWLSQREMCGEPLLTFVGNFEDALFFLQNASSGIASMDVIQLVLSHLIKQRREIKLLMEKHELQHCCERAHISLPDAHVGCMLAALENEGVDVPQRYWPKRKSLYYMTPMWGFDRLRLLETIELAGFCDISQEDFKCNEDTACSP